MNQLRSMNGSIFCAVYFSYLKPAQRTFLTKKVLVYGIGNLWRILMITNWSKGSIWYHSESSDCSKVPYSSNKNLAKHKIALKYLVSRQIFLDEIKRTIDSCFETMEKINWYNRFYKVDYLKSHAINQFIM